MRGVGREEVDLPKATVWRRLASPCRAGTRVGRIGTRSGRLRGLMTSRSTSRSPVRLTGYWSSLRLVTGELRSRLLWQRADVWSGLNLLRRCSRRRESVRLRWESNSTYAKETYGSLKSRNRRP